MQKNYCRIIQLQTSLHSRRKTDFLPNSCVQTQHFGDTIGHGKRQIDSFAMCLEMPEDVNSLDSVKSVRCSESEKRTKTGTVDLSHDNAPLDSATQEHGGRELHCLRQLRDLSEQELTKLLTKFNLATDGSVGQRVHHLYDCWEHEDQHVLEEQLMKTPPEHESAGSDEDHKDDLTNPSFLAALPESELHNLLRGRGKSVDGDRGVLEDRVIECHRQEQGFPSGSDHSNSDEDEEDALDPSKAGGTSKKRSASGSETFDARDPLRTGQDRSAITKICLPPPCCFVRCNCAALEYCTCEHAIFFVVILIPHKAKSAAASCLACKHACVPNQFVSVRTAA